MISLYLLELINESYYWWLFRLPDIGKKSTSKLSKQEEIPKRGEKFNVKSDLWKPRGRFLQHHNLFRQQSVGVLTAVTARKIRFILWEITLLDTLSHYFVVFINQFIIARDNFFQQLLLTNSFSRDIWVLSFCLCLLGSGKKYNATQRKSMQFNEIQVIGNEEWTKQKKNDKTGHTTIKKLTKSILKKIDNI